MKKKRKTNPEEIDNAVLIYLENFKRVCEEPFSRLTLFGVKASGITKYLKNNQVAEKWGEEITDKIWDAVDKIYEKYIVEFPEIPEPTEIDIFIAKMFIKNGWWSLCNSEFFIQPVNMKHIIKYLQRDKEIYTWNADFILNVQREYARAKEFLTGDKTEYSDYFSLLREYGVSI